MATKVNQETCIGCGACVAICPQGFELNAEGKSAVKDAGADCAQQASEACPVQAITV